MGFGDLGLQNKITEPDRVMEEIIQFYVKLHFEAERWRPDGNLVNSPSILEEEILQLHANFEE